MLVVWPWQAQWQYRLERSYSPPPCLWKGPPQSSGSRLSWPLSSWPGHLSTWLQISWVRLTSSRPLTGSCWVIRSGLLCWSCPALGIQPGWRPTCLPWIRCCKSFSAMPRFGSHSSLIHTPAPVDGTRSLPWNNNIGTFFLIFSS